MLRIATDVCSCVGWFGLPPPPTIALNAYPLQPNPSSCFSPSFATIWFPSMKMPPMYRFLLPDPKTSARQISWQQPNVDVFFSSCLKFFKHYFPRIFQWPSWHRTESKIKKKEGRKSQFFESGWIVNVPAIPGIMFFPELVCFY